MSQRADREIRHGEFLAEADPEVIWGWATPAGRLRARRRAQLISIGARLDQATRALEIGCGTGLFTEMFAQTGCSLVAVDLSSALLEIAKTRKLPEERVQFVRQRFENFTNDCSFDAVIGSSVLHHLELKIALPKILKLLKPGGFISFAEPNMLNPQVFAERKLRRLFPKISPDETAFVRWSLDRDLRSAGFRSIEISPFDWLHPSMPANLIGFASTVGFRMEGIPFLRELAGSLSIVASRPLG